MNKRFVTAWLVVCLVWLAGTLIVRVTLTNNADIAVVDIMRPTTDQTALLIFGLIVHALIAAAFVWIYQLRKQTQPWLWQGLKFGLMISLLVPVPIALFYYTMQQMPGPKAITLVVSECVVVIAAAVAAAFVYRNYARG